MLAMLAMRRRVRTAESSGERADRLEDDGDVGGVIAPAGRDVHRVDMRGEQQRVSRLVAVIIAMMRRNPNPNPRGERVRTIVRHRLLARLAHARGREVGTSRDGACAARPPPPRPEDAARVSAATPRSARSGFSSAACSASEPASRGHQGTTRTRPRAPRRRPTRAHPGRGGGEGPVVVQRERAGGRDQRQGHDALDAKPRVVRHETRQGVGGPRARAHAVAK